MNTHAQPRGGFTILLTLVAALIIMLLPIHQLVDRLRPDLLLLVLIYWTMALPHRISIFTGFAAGLLMDGATGSLVGQHAFAYSLILWSVTLNHKRLRLAPLWQQTAIIVLMLLFERLVSAVVLGVTRSTLPDQIYWAAPFVAIIIWPWLFPLMRNIRRQSYVS